MSVLVARAAIVACDFGVAAPALAGECAADQGRVNRLAGAPSAGKAVTDTVLGAVDLGKEISVDDRGE